MADDVVDLTAEESAEGDDALQPFQQVQHVAASPSTAEDHNTLQALDQELRKLVSQREALDRRVSDSPLRLICSSLHYQVYLDRAVE